MNFLQAIHRLCGDQEAITLPRESWYLVIEDNILMLVDQAKGVRRPYFFSHADLGRPDWEVVVPLERARATTEILEMISDLRRRVKALEDLL